MHTSRCHGPALPTVSPTRLHGSAARTTPNEAVMHKAGLCYALCYGLCGAAVLVAHPTTMPQRPLRLPCCCLSCLVVHAVALRCEFVRRLTAS